MSQMGSVIAYAMLAESGIKVSVRKTPQKTRHKGNCIKNSQVTMDLILVCSWYRD